MSGLSSVDPTGQARPATRGTAIAVRRRLGGAGARDDGFSVVELVVVVPIFLVLLLVVIAAGRVQDTGVRITGAARDGARAASLERTPQAAEAAARQVVLANLAGQSLECAGGPITTVSTSAFAPGGRVQVTVTCTADLKDVAFRGLPGSARLSKAASSPVETYRGTG